MTDNDFSQIEEILTEALGLPTEREQTVAWRIGRPHGGGIAPKQARELLKKRRKQAKKPPPDVTLENIERAVEALRYQLEHLDPDAAHLLDEVPGIRAGLDKLAGPGQTGGAGAARDDMVCALDALVRDVQVLRGWLDHVVKVSGYKGRRDPKYRERMCALYVAETLRERTNAMPWMPNQQSGPEGSLYALLLRDIFPKLGFEERSIWRAGRWAINEIAQEK